MKIATIDFETDPFEHGLIVEPFCCGFYDEDTYIDFWGPDCADKLMEYIGELKEPYIIYAHNGGKFDFFFILKHFKGHLRIVNGRILEATYKAHKFRDSFAILPVGLAKMEKQVFDYTKLYKNKRNKYKQEILNYLQSDCINLYKYVKLFLDEFGDKLTIGSAAMSELKKFHSFEQTNDAFDAKFRPFYYGGRVQCFHVGMYKGPLKVFDVNSMYPDVMKNSKHPVSKGHEVSRKITNKTCFAIIEGKNYGAFPARTDSGLDFNIPYGKFMVTKHELDAAEETGTFTIDRVHCSYDFNRTISFADFIDHFYSRRMTARGIGDSALDLFYKLILNSSYGKFALNPENFAEYKITSIDEYLDNTEDEPWVIKEENALGYRIWEMPSPQKRYYNVATAASITGAARAKLLLGLAKATRPIYCDTDSIVCENMTVHADPKTLGAWKLEAEGDTMAIAGKKLYALFKNGKAIKFASKGGTLTPDEIKACALGDEIEYKNAVPNFKLTGQHRFVTRTFKKTGKAGWINPNKN